MQDRFREHITQQREDFEVYDLNIEESWVHVSQSLKPKPKSRRVFWISGVAASLLVLMTLAGGLFIKKEKVEFAINSEWLEAEGYYLQEIDTKWTLVQSQVKDQELLADIRMMDDVFAELKKDLKDNVDNEEVITAMMDSYRLKLKVLDRILKEIEEQKKNEKDTLMAL